MYVDFFGVVAILFGPLHFGRGGDGVWEGCCRYFLGSSHGFVSYGTRLYFRNFIPYLQLARHFKLLHSL